MSAHPIPDAALDADIAPWAAHVADLKARHGASEIVIDERFTVDASIIDRLFDGRVILGAKGCWLWNGYRRNGQHCAISTHDEMIYVHRLANGLEFGAIRAGIEVCHSCDTPNCINHDHHFRGTQADNIADMIGKGRDRKDTPRGVRNWNATLTDDQVIALIARAAEAGIKQRDVAKEFGVSQSTVWRHVHGKVRQETHG